MFYNEYVSTPARLKPVTGVKIHSRTTLDQNNCEQSVLCELKSETTKIT